jgi:hypothetical protein
MTAIASILLAAATAAPTAALPPQPAVPAPRPAVPTTPAVAAPQTSASLPREPRDTVASQQRRPPQTGPQGRFGFLTAAELVDQCNGKSPYALTYCYAYLGGLHDAMRAYEVWLGHPEFCAPARVALEELRRIFLAFVEANPGYRDGQGASVGAVALKGAYPCGSASH